MENPIKIGWFGGNLIVGNLHIGDFPNLRRNYSFWDGVERFKDPDLIEFDLQKENRWFSQQPNKQILLNQTNKKKGSIEWDLTNKQDCFIGLNEINAGIWWHFLIDDHSIS